MFFKSGEEGEREDKGEGRNLPFVLFKRKHIQIKKMGDRVQREKSHKAQGPGGGDKKEVFIIIIIIIIVTES